MAKAVIFDKDGVILLNSHLYFTGWEAIFRKYDKKLTKEFHDRFISGRAGKESIRKHLDSDISDNRAGDLIKEHFTFTKDQFFHELKPVVGVIAFLKALKDANMPIALATSGRKSVTDMALDAFGIQDKFQTVITVEDIKKSKPDPEIYFKAAGNLQVNPNECVVFEDSYSGIEAAKRAGMKVVLVMTSHTQKEIPDVDLAIKDFTRITLKDVLSL